MITVYIYFITKVDKERKIKLQTSKEIGNLI